MTKKLKIQTQTIKPEVGEELPRSTGPKNSFYDMSNVVVVAGNKQGGVSVFTLATLYEK